MKKSLIALAVAGAVSAPAFAATSNVDIYGQLTLSYDYINTDTNVVGADKKLSRISSNSSRIGFKGSEDLGGGLAAIWQIENQLDMDNGTNNLTGGTLGAGGFSTAMRNTFVGLKSNSFGTVLLGKHDTPYKLATGKLDIFADTLGDYNNIVGNVNGSNNFDLRPGNVAAYITPTFSGLHGAIAYVAGNEVGNGTAPNQSAWSAMGMYDNGPLFASLAYEKHNNLNATGDDRDAWKAGVGYKFGDAQLGLIYEDAETVLGANNVKSRKAWYLNGQYTMGAIVLKAAYGRAGDVKTQADTSARTFDLGADYNLSKRTKMYAVYQKTNNDTNGTYGLGAGQGSALTPGAGEDPSAFSIGVRHTF
ncbi:MAG: porin [Thiobacillus sp.]|nr:porin [Thiobacillus sp.]